MRRSILALAPAMFAAALAVTPAAAESPSAHLKPLDDATLDAARGGFVWGGMSISFGADLQTFLNGQLALRTLVQWSDSGGTTTTLVGGSLTPATLAAANVQTPGAINIPATLGSNQAYLANAGQTAVVQGANNGLQNILVNAANGLTATQMTNATLTLGNYTAFASALRSQVLGSVIGTQTAGIGR